MIKKKDPSQADKKTWEEYIKNPSDIYDKDQGASSSVQRRERYKFDLHGFTLDEANNKVKEIENNLIDNIFKKSISNFKPFFSLEKKVVGEDHNHKINKVYNFLKKAKEVL